MVQRAQLARVARQLAPRTVVRIAAVDAHARRVRVPVVRRDVPVDIIRHVARHAIPGVVQPRRQMRGAEEPLLLPRHHGEEDGRMESLGKPVREHASQLDHVRRAQCVIVGARCIVHRIHRIQRAAAGIVMAREHHHAIRVASRQPRQHVDDVDRWMVRRARQRHHGRIVFHAQTPAALCADGAERGVDVPSRGANAPCAARRVAQRVARAERRQHRIGVPDVRRRDVVQRERERRVLREAGRCSHRVPHNGDLRADAQRRHGGERNARRAERHRA